MEVKWLGFRDRSMAFCATCIKPLTVTRDMEGERLLYCTNCEEYESYDPVDVEEVFHRR